MRRLNKLMPVASCRRITSCFLSVFGADKDVRLLFEAGHFICFKARISISMAAREDFAVGVHALSGFEEMKSS